MRGRHGRVTTLLAAAALSAGAADAAAAPEIVSFRFLEPPHAGRPATLEVHVRDEGAPVDDVHVHWGDGVSYATLRPPGPLEPAGSPQRVTLEHSYERPGRYPLRIEAFSRTGRAERGAPVAVAPCARPRASVELLAPARAGRMARLRVIARDDDSLIRKLRIAWGDGAARSVTYRPPAAAKHGDALDVVLKHRYRRAGRFKARLDVASSGNPPECTGGEVERATRRWTIRVAPRSRGGK